MPKASEAKARKNNRLTLGDKALITGVKVAATGMVVLGLTVQGVREKLEDKGILKKDLRNR